MMTRDLALGSSTIAQRPTSQKSISATAWRERRRPEDGASEVKLQVAYGSRPRDVARRIPKVQDAVQPDARRSRAPEQIRLDGLDLAGSRARSMADSVPVPPAPSLKGAPPAQPVASTSTAAAESSAGPQRTKPKLKRASAACVACRSVKARCVGLGNPPKVRGRESGIADCAGALRPLRQARHRVHDPAITTRQGPTQEATILGADRDA